jgi:hypothetical protein
MVTHVRNNFCIAPFTQLTFGPNGIYSPCPEIGGRAWKEPSASPVLMWTSDDYNVLRESFSNNEKNPVCNRCWGQEEQKNVSRYCDQVRIELAKTFVKNYLGRYRSREELISHNTETAVSLFSVD